MTDKKDVVDLAIRKAGGRQKPRKKNLNHFQAKNSFVTFLLNIDICLHVAQFTPA